MRKDNRHKKIVMILLCIILALHCLHGKEYALCKDIAPCEIMDLQGVFTISDSEIERPACLNEINPHESHSRAVRDMDSVLIISLVKFYFPIDFYDMLDSKKRLFTFHHYNS